LEKSKPQINDINVLQAPFQRLLFKSGLTAMDQRNAILDADAGILRAGWLAIEHWVDDAGAAFGSDGYAGRFRLLKGFNVA
jgi:hypothetical protein